MQADRHWWSRLGSNQRPSACEADALPLSHGTGRVLRAPAQATSAARWNTSTQSHFRWERTSRAAPRGHLCPVATVHYCRNSRRAAIPPEACGCSAVGSASPCQGEGRGFESRHPLEGATASDPRWSGRVVRQRPAKPCTRVRFPSPPPDSIPGAISSAGERFPDTEEVTGSIPVSRTSKAVHRRFFAASNAAWIRSASGSRRTLGLRCSRPGPHPDARRTRRIRLLRSTSPA